MPKDTVFINDQQGLKDLIDLVARQDNSIGDLQPLLYIDLEGERLSRHGKVSLVTVLVYLGLGLEYSYIIDIHTLGSTAFSTVGSLGKSLKDILESPQILKVFFDVRNDSDALYAHYGIALQGVRDIQLMENASRPTTKRRKFLSGLSKCIEGVTYGKKRDQWKLSKEKGESLWDPKKGGSYNVFNTRPLPNEITSYCVGDVRYLSALYRKYYRDRNDWNCLIAEESQKRVAESQTVEYQPHEPEKGMSSWSTEQNKMLDSWNTPYKSRDYFSHSKK
ncbi:hypothetical protein ASPZODRAFT_132945 [Penicilliopsis zonata CBS 506.65]|uniref:3'-5' exonuclease domain-containing protein n=1 Tax=Penicilliopsis zonata CBS 506.65 TaxID=1073090 RepID=A0A1L9SHV1_9EURO|nr:hypothetical protein ASPZODRAFT_132945 [Penicilliopsis zonata CBS 506.65]OJJ46792.1 hypothetical protein ASPZODRAFT_132945 [Penicilliopsis zonata CBS 506.65]